MTFRSLNRIFRTSMVSFWRNRWLSLAATLMMVLTLFIISFFVSILLITNKTTESLRSKVDMSVYFNDSTSKDQIFALQNILLSRSDIKSVEYKSKERALEIWRENHRDNIKIRDAISETNNPLPRSLDVKTERPEDLENINVFLSAADYKPLILEVSYTNSKIIIDRLVKITNFAENVGWTASAIFVIISVLIIFNAISLAINSRREEIEIMRLVGASDWYVQGPFFIEGAGYGLLGAILASIISLAVIKFSFPAVVNYLGGASADLIFSGINYWIIIGLEVIVGLFLGISCTILATRKYLK
ncbi:MAG: permease-like cell division protein FtsX [bacterium]